MAPFLFNKDRSVEKSNSASGQVAQGIIVLCFLLPLVFFPGLLSLYRLPKLTLCAFLTCVLCWLWLTHTRKEQQHLPTFPLFIPVLLYILANVLSLFNAINPYEGATFLFQLILGVALFWLAANHLDKERAVTFFHWITVAGAIVSLLGIAQVWGLNIPTLIPTGGPGSTFGNKNMAAQYILFVIPASLYLLLVTAKAKKEWLYASVSALMATYFTYTGTRAAWGAATFAMIALSSCLWSSRPMPIRIFSLRKRKLAFLTGIAAFVLGMHLLPRYLIPGWNVAGYASPLARLGTMIDLDQDPSARHRYAIWANSWAMFRDHPILGVGKGNFRFVYPLYARKVTEDPSFSAQSRAADAHNDYLQVLVETGLLGTMAFLVILSLLARRFWEGITKSFDTRIIPVAVAIVAILAESFWDFPFNLPVPIAFFWLYAGILWRWSQTGPTGESEKLSKTSSLVPILLLALVSTVFAIFTASSLRGEFYYSRGAKALYSEKWLEAGKDLARATRLGPFNYRYHFMHGLFTLRKGDYPKATASLLRSLSLNPYNINALNNLGIAYASQGQIPKAVQAWETSIRIWPNHVEAHSNLGTIHARQGEKDKAAYHFREVLRFNPKDPKASAALRVITGYPQKPQ